MASDYEIDVARGAVRVTLDTPVELDEFETILECVADDPLYSPELAWIFDARALETVPPDTFQETIRLMARQALLFMGNEQAIVVADAHVYELVEAYEKQMKAVGMRVNVFLDLESADDWLRSRRSPEARQQGEDERRTFRRVEFMSPAVIIPDPEADDRPLPAEVLNLGCGGALLRTYGRVDKGTRWTIRILNPAGPTGAADEVSGVVRRAQVKLGASFLGFEFDTRLLAVHTGLPAQVVAPLEVLVVDDEPEVQSVLERFFQVHGCDVTTAPDGDEALAAVRDRRPDLVLLDLNMPGMDGLKVLDRIRAEALEVGPVWAFSGYVSDAEATEAMELGAVGFLNKPFDFGFLQRILRVSPLL